MSERNRVPRTDAAAAAERPLRFYEFVVTAFVVILISSQLIGPGKVARLFGVTFGAGILFFPLSYVVGDILTEVYGYARARRAVWAGFAALAYIAVMSAVIVAIPPADGWTGQRELAAIFGQTPRIVAASLTAFWAGEFANSFVLARLKLLTRGRMLWTRTIGSTVVAQAFDSAIFYPLAFYGVWTNAQLASVMTANYLLKVSWEVILTPVTYRLVAALKHAEQLDVFDAGTNFTPFTTRL